MQVNRAWAQFFGRGIVASEEDFGTQAEPPTHPELLDWLAAEFARPRLVAQTHPSADRRVGDVPAVVASSAATWPPRDPNNLLLARGPRLRLTAELIRDNALAVSGRLAARCTARRSIRRSRKAFGA